MLYVVLAALYMTFASTHCVKEPFPPKFHPLPFINVTPNHQSPTKYRVGGKFAKELCKKVRRSIMLHREMPWERDERLKKVEQSQKDGLLPNPKTSYDSYILYKPHPLSELKSRLKHIKDKLEAVGGEEISALYCGLKKLTKPIRDCDEAYLICFSYTVFPSLYWPIRYRLIKEDNCLRVLTIKDTHKNHKRRVYRRDIYPQTPLNHPYKDSEVFRGLFEMTEDDFDAGDDSEIRDDSDAGDDLLGTAPDV